MSERLAAKPTTRRDFLGMSGLWLAGVALFGSVLGMVRLPKPRVLPEASSLVRIGPPEAFPPGTIKVFPEHKIRLMATDQGIAAMSLICTHLGCIVQETPSGFQCPCHGSKFTSEGKVTGGPAPRALAWLPVSQAPDGTLLVETSKEIEAGQFFRV